jgi:hypothetical protein
MGFFLPDRFFAVPVGKKSGLVKMEDIALEFCGKNL